MVGSVLGLRNCVDVVLRDLTRLLVSGFPSASYFQSIHKLDVLLLQQLSSKGWRVDLLH